MNQFSRTIPLIGPDGVRRIADVRLTDHWLKGRVWAPRLFFRDDRHKVTACDGYCLAARITEKQLFTAVRLFHNLITLAYHRDEKGEIIP